MQNKKTGIAGKGAPYAAVGCASLQCHNGVVKHLLGLDLYPVEPKAIRKT